MFKKLLWGFFFLILALVLVAGGFVLATGSPQAAVTQARTRLGLESAVQQRGTTAIAPQTGSAAGAPAAGQFGSRPAGARAAGQTTSGQAGESLALTGQTSDGQAMDLTDPDTLAAMTTAVRSAGDLLGSVSAAGNLELAASRQVGVQIGGRVTEILVEVGDPVRTGDALLRLDAADAEEAVHRAMLDLSSAQLDIQKLYDATDPADIGAAEADLASAQEDLAEVLDGAGDRELAAARASASSAWAKYNELQAGPSDAQLVQKSSALRKAELALQEAQRAYDAIAWRSDIGRTPQAATLQQATIDYESAQAAYEESTQAASTSDLQSALSQAQNAQRTLDQLLEGASNAQIAAAQAKVATAQAKLADLQTGVNETDLAAANIRLEEAEINLQGAMDDLARTEVQAPMDGVILSVNPVLGQQMNSGAVAVTMADPVNLKLVVSVAEVDVSQLQDDQPATIEIDALPGRSLEGIISSIAPSADPSQGVVNYPVTIKLLPQEMSQVRAGMTAVATIANQENGAGWLVPAGSVRAGQDGNSLVIRVRDGQPTRVPVVTGSAQGEWVVVQSDQLAQGDRVMGATTTLVGDENPFQFGAGRPPGAAPGGGGAIIRQPGGGR